MTKRVNGDEQYKPILERRSSGPKSYQWCKDHGLSPGTFYNWNKWFRKKACYDTPAPAGRDDFYPQEVQEVVPLMVIDNETEVPSITKVEQNNSSIASVAVLTCAATRLKSYFMRVMSSCFYVNVLMLGRKIQATKKQCTYHPHHRSEYIYRFGFGHYSAEYYHG